MSSRSSVESQLLLDVSTEGLCIVNLHGRIIDANQYCMKLLGYEKKELLALTLNNINPSLNNTNLNQQVNNGKLDTDYRTVLKHKNGKRIKVSLSVFYDASQSEHFYVSIKSIKNEINAQTRTTIIDKIFNNSTEAIIVTNRKGEILLVNEAFHHITGYSFDEVKNKTPAILKSGRQDEKFYQHFWRALKTNGSWSGEIWNKRKNGNIYPEWLNVTNIVNDNGDTTHYVGQFSDISILKNSARLQAFHAYHDPLTYLPNRRLLFERIEKLQHENIGGDSNFVVMYCDIDRFKLINDSLGHNVGDEVIKVISSMLKGAMRGNDTVARSGGDEFIILLEDVNNIDGIKQVAEKLVGLFNHPVKTKYGDFYVTVSIGVSRYPFDSNNVTELISFADTAMLQVKSVGGNNYYLFDSKQKDNILHQIKLENYIFNALKNNEFELWYQPQINSDTQQVYGVECLLRWRHPSYGLISPEVFIPIAEKNGLIKQLGKFVIDTAGRQLKQWRNSKIFDGVVAVNVSMRQFDNNELFEQVENMLSTEKVPADRIEIEVTESIFVKDERFHVDTLQQLRGLGIKIAIDDFGTGYSSLVRLKQLPIDNLKIDKCFVDNLGSSDEDLAIVNALCLLSSSFGIDIIAEGVEHKEQATMLNELGCCNHQGYFYGKPMPADKFEQWKVDFDCENKTVAAV